MVEMELNHKSKNLICVALKTRRHKVLLNK